MQLETRVIQDNAVHDLKMRMRNNQPLRARNFANSADVNLFKLDASDLLYFSAQPKFAGVPALADDLVNMQMLQDYVTGVINLKDAVVVANSSNMALTGSTPLVVDGVTLAAGNRVGLVGQTSGIQNGIYVVGIVSTTWTLTRSLDFDDSPGTEVRQGSSFDVLSGTANAKKRFLLTTVNPTVGTDVLTFVEVPAGAAVPINLEEIITLSGTNITNQYVDLLDLSLEPSVKVFFSGVLQTKGTDYTLSTVSTKTRVTFAGDLATGGAIALISGDKITVCYEK
jgi:hypothetical protein